MQGNVPPEIMNHLRAQQLARRETSGVAPATRRGAEEVEPANDRKETSPIIKVSERLRRLALAATGTESPGGQSS